MDEQTPSAPFPPPFAEDKGAPETPAQEAAPAAQPLEQKTDQQPEQRPAHSRHAPLPDEEAERLNTLALKRFKEIVAGNGVAAEAITLKNFEGAVLHLKAVTRLTPNKKLSTRQQAGRASGPEIVGNAAALSTAIDKEETRIFSAPDIIQRLHDLITGRNDKGIALKNVQIKTPFLHKDYVYHEPCKACGGKGKARCNRCHGKGVESCPRCYASGMESCGACGGRQYIQGPNGQDVQCQRCNGTGKLPCSLCYQAKQIQCTSCRATGAIQCKQCNGHAIISVLTKAEINVNATYEFDRTHLEAPLIAKIEQTGAKIIAHAAHIQIAPPTGAQANNKAHETAVLYDITLPIAQMHFTLPTGPDKPPHDVPVRLFGIQPALYDAPPFLENLIAPGLQHLESAVAGSGDIHAHIRAALRYKLIRLMLVATSKLGPKKAALAARAKIEIGLSDHGAQKLAFLADRVLNRAARKHGYIGGGIGALASALLLYLYASALRADLLEYAANPAQGYMIDTAALACAAGIGWLCLRLIRARGKKRGLQALLQQAAQRPQKKKAAPEQSEDHPASGQ